MKTTKFIATLLMLVMAVSTMQAQVVKRTDGDSKKKTEGGVLITDRQQSFFEVKEASDADLQWLKVIYRSLDLTKGKNPALYYPEEPNEDGMNLFYIILRNLASGQIPAYEYLDGKEIFDDDHKVNVGEELDRFYITHTQAKGSTEKNPKFEIDDSDVPSNQVLSYYVIERWEFDTRSNQMKTRVEAICPVLHRTDEFGGEAIKYPMFWVKLNDIRPYMAQQYVFTDDDNNLPRYSLDDFFKLNMYSGEIYKTKNLRNLSLMQQYPEEDALKQAQDSIEQRLRAFNKDLWVPTREELQAMAKAKAELEEGEDGEEAADEETVEVKPKKKSVKKDTSEKTTTKRGKKTTNIKERKPKAVKSSSSSATRSVRNRKR